MKTIGMVVEGHHDYHMICPLIEEEFKLRGHDSISFRYLLPSQDQTGKFASGGYARVIGWCRSNAGTAIETYFTPLFANEPACDALLIHIDGDALTPALEQSSIAHPGPTPSVQERITAMIGALEEWLSLANENRDRIAFAVPVLHTEAWIVSALHPEADIEIKDAKRVLRSKQNPSTNPKMDSYYRHCGSEAAKKIPDILSRCRSYNAFRRELVRLT